MKRKKLIDHATFRPKKLFLVDGIGAITSAFLLGIVLVRLERYFGIPASTLYFLATFPIIFASYDFYCLRRVSNKQGKFLKAIAIANLLYCGLSLGVLLYHKEIITSLGRAYIIVEVMIVVFLAIIELIIAKRWLKNEPTLNHD